MLLKHSSIASTTALASCGCRQIEWGVDCPPGATRFLMNSRSELFDEGRNPTSLRISRKRRPRSLKLRKISKREDQITKGREELTRFVHPPYYRGPRNQLQIHHQVVVVKRWVQFVRCKTHYLSRTSHKSGCFHRRGFHCAGGIGGAKDQRGFTLYRYE